MKTILYPFDQFLLIAALALLVGMTVRPLTVRAQAQAIDGTIEGQLSDPDANALAGGGVQAVNKNTGYRREATTSDDGRYQIPLLPPGTYDVTVRSNGFAQLTRTIELNAGQTLTLDFNLSIGEVTTQVEVTAETPVVEPGRTVLSNTYEEETLRNVPTVGRSLLDFFVLQPGVNARPLSTGGSGTGTPTTVYGGLGLRQINVDGVSNNLQGGARNLVISQEAVQEVQTVTNFSAEFGRTGGGLQNAFTRSGGNDLHGSAFLFTRQKFLGATPFLLPAGAPKPDFSRYNAGGTISGPVKRERAFFFVSYERWIQDLPGVASITPTNAATLGIPADSIGAINQTFRAHTVTARTDIQVTQNNRLSARYNYYFDRESPLGSGQQSRETLSRFDEAPSSFTTQFVSILGPRILNEARFLFATRSISNGVISENAPNINISGVAGFNGNSSGTFTSRERGFQIIDNVSVTFDRHALKFGVDVLPVTFRERTRNVNGSFTFGGLTAVSDVRGAVSPLNQFLLTESGALDPATNRPYSYTRFTQSIGQEFTASKVVNQGYFVQDDYQATNRLKLNFGLRYEYFKRPEGNLNPALPATGVIPQDKNNFAPRLGLAYDVTGDGRTVLRGGYGTYYNTTVAQTYNNIVRSNGLSVININVSPTTLGAPAFTRNAVAPPAGVNVISDVRVFDPNFQDITVHNYFTTFEHQLFGDIAVSATYQGTRGRNLPVSLNANIRQVGALADGRPTYSTAERPDPRFGNIFVAQSIGEQNYNGLVTTLTKRFAKGYSFQTSYHLSKVEGTAFSDDFTGFGIFTQSSDPLNLEVDRGPGDFDQRHRFTFVGVAQPRLNSLTGLSDALFNGYEISSRIIASSGFRFNATTGRDDNGDTLINDRPSGIGYNAFRLPSYFTFDLRLSRRLRFGENTNLELIAEGFNLTNRLNPTNVNRNYGFGATPNATFNQVTAAENARQFQLAARFNF